MPAYSAIDTSIRIAFEEQGATPAEIAAEMCLDVKAVEYSLANNSPVYRKFLRQQKQDVNYSPVDSSESMQILGTPTKEDVTQEESDELLTEMKRLALTAEDEGIRLRAATFLFNERKGRNHVVNGAIGAQVPLSALNNLIRNAIGRANELKDASPVIDITPPNAVTHKPVPGFPYPHKA